MKDQFKPQTKQAPKRRWPFDLSTYDRSHSLTSREIQALASVTSMRETGNKHWLTENGDALVRLLRPVDDVLDYIGVRERCYRTGTKSNLLRAMHRRGTCFWAWSTSDWVEVLGISYRDFDKDCAYHECRSSLIAFSYLTSGFTDLYLFGPHSSYKLAHRIFGKQAVSSAIETVCSELRRIGYGHTITVTRAPNALCKAMLLSRSPRLKDIKLKALVMVRDQYKSKTTAEDVIPLSRALAVLNIISSPLKPRVGRRPLADGAATNVPPEWMDWCTRWKETSPLEPRTYKGLFYCLLKTGRWMRKAHPELSSPQAWTYEAAVDYVAALMRSKIGDWSVRNVAHKNKLGEPLSPRAVAQSLAAMRMFFRDCQEWGWIQRQFDPGRAFRTPPSIRAKIAPDPRVIADDIWAKLMWAGLNLTVEDLPRYPCNISDEAIHYYPIEMVRALALVWLFAGLRVNEITRLRVGCVRWQREDVTVHETGEVLPKDAVCWLDVPVGKMKHAFTKPVDLVLGEAVDAWERVRPEQPPALDEKTREMVHYLFSLRGKQVGEVYINRRLIHLLCKKAGVPEQDARGCITSHRARPTIATQLYNAKEPMDLFELQDWLGHRNPNSTQHYARVNPTKLAKKYEKAGYFERNVRTMEVLIDRDAIVSGAAARGEPWQYYDLGHGWCTNAYFVECPHRMACPKCQFYVPKDSARGQFIEGQSNLQLMLQRIPLTEEERAAVEEGVEMFESLCRRLADVPTPSGPTPRQLVQLTRSGKEDS